MRATMYSMAGVFVQSSVVIPRLDKRGLGQILLRACYSRSFCRLHSSSGLHSGLQVEVFLDLAIEAV